MSDEEEIYCICRSSDVSRFMIGCDHCEEWYHGDCIQVTSKDSKYIKKFYCKECRDKNPHLKVVYKSKYLEKMKEMEKTKEKKEEKKEKKSKEKKKSKDKDRERSRSRERHKHKEKKHKKDKDREKEKEETKDKKKDKESKSKPEKKEPKSRAIISDSDDDEEFDKSVELMKIEEEKERERKREKEKERELERERQKLREEKKKEKEAEERKKKEAEAKIKKERSESTENRNKSTESSDSRKVLQAKDIENINKYDSEDEWKPKVSAPPAPSVATKHKRKPFKETGFNKRKRPWGPSYDSSDEEETHDLRPRQCYGMECVKCARVGSKYCSDQCGLTVASLRIYQTLPERIREWNMTPCQAEQKNRGELETIREDIQNTKQRLEELDKEAEQLENTIARGKTLSVIEHKSEDSSDEEDELKSSGAVNCISCGKDVPSRTAIRHMESCFNKFESQTSFGSMYKTKIEGYQMFCDYFNPQTETYCKRLRVICPEHTKDHKVLDTEVCGFPLAKDVFKESGEFCRCSKKKCNDHFGWEKLKRAEVDMDRVRQWLKLDELLEKERQEKEAMSRRAGVLNLLLHSTFNHELAMILQQKKSRANPTSQTKQPKRL